MKRNNTIKGPALVANVEGLTSGTRTPAPQPKILVAGWCGHILLDPLNLANQFNGGLIEAACGEDYYVGTVAGVYLRTEAVHIMMFEKASRNGPATNWKWTHSGDGLDIELRVNEFRFAHVGVGKNEDTSGLFAQSFHNTTKPALTSVTLFPADCDYNAIGKRMAMYDRVISATVLPPPPKNPGSWLIEKYRKYPNSFPAYGA